MNSLNLVSYEDKGQVLHCLFRLSSTSTLIHISGIYGAHNEVNRTTLFAEIVEYARKVVSIPWFLGGDFNAISSVAEHKGKCDPNLIEIAKSQQCISDSGLLESSFSGPSFTWTGIRSRGRVWRKLDKVLYNETFSSSFPHHNLVHLAIGASDHCPLVFTINGPLHGTPSRFRFLNLWVQDRTFQERVKKTWNNSFHGRGMRGLMIKLEELRKDLKHWSYNNYGNLFQAFERSEKDLLAAVNLFASDPSPDNLSALNLQKAKHSKCINNIDSFWRQKANIKWIKEGEANTSFFHNYVKGKRKRLLITHISKGDDNFLESQEDIIADGLSFFKKAFCEEPTLTDSDLLQSIPVVISEEDNTMLTRLPNETEVWEAIFAIDPNSCAGWDGFNGFFVKNGFTPMSYRVRFMTGFDNAKPS
ncbi:unnamed protein product [Cuscuta campestris]|uniref:Endonuclease/exonuclease/phosphatase domain-containing protein n=1 Tax=Cuscuta campestris TaxID=132261 RepID=A0A484M5J9_9ASTE|nr:unnamed protein product [Cuscuta campestris]